MEHNTRSKLTTFRSIILHRQRGPWLWRGLVDGYQGKPYCPEYETLYYIHASDYEMGRLNGVAGREAGMMLPRFNPRSEASIELLATFWQVSRATHGQHTSPWRSAYPPPAVERPVPERLKLLSIDDLDI